MSGFKKYLSEDRRLRILELLRDSGGSINEDVIRIGLENMGHAKLSRRVVREDLRFLIGHGLIVDEWIDDLQIATLTKRGVETADGLVEVTGVKRPSIGI